MKELDEINSFKEKINAEIYNSIQEFDKALNKSDKSLMTKYGVQIKYYYKLLEEINKKIDSFH